MSETDWSELGVSELPTGTVTLLLADVEGSTRLWETQPEEMTAAVARLDQEVAGAIAAHGGIRPVEQGEGDSFVVAFARASDAVACAMDLQRASLAPIKLRIGVHTGEVRLRDEGNYIGPTINRTARLRDLAHGGQTVLSGATEPLVVDQLPTGVWLTELGTHPLRDLPRPERVVQLCHPDLRNDFPPLRTPSTVVSHNLPVQLTSFVGRQAEMESLREALTSNRLVTLTGAGDIERYQVLDQLTLLVDKSLIVAENTRGPTRYRLLETVRQYALEKLGESGEADAVRSRHCDYYTSMAALLDAPARTDYEQRVWQAEIEMDNLRSAFGWSLENSNIERALAHASSLQPLWISRGRIREGRAWFDTAFTADDPHRSEAAAAVRARALADRSVLDAWTLGGAGASMDHAQQALAIAREIDDPALLTRALTACGHIAGYSDNAEAARTYLDEAAGLARVLDDRWRLSQILAYQSFAAVAGDPAGSRVAAEEGCDVAAAIGDRSGFRECSIGLGWAQLMQGDVVGAVAQFRSVVAEVEATYVVRLKPAGLMGLGSALAHRGEENAARDVADSAIESARELGEYFSGMGYAALTIAALAGADVETAKEASEAAWQRMSYQRQSAAALRTRIAEVALAGGDLVGARRWADEAVATTTGWHRVAALLTRARVAIGEGDPD